MATPKTITGKVTTPGGVALAGVPVAATISQACIIVGTQEVVPATVTAVTAADGTFSLPLYANNDLTPNGTYYTVTEAGGGGGFYEFTITVPQTAGPFAISSLIASPPAAPPVSGHVSTMLVDGATATGIPLSVLGTAAADATKANLEVGGAALGAGSGTFDGTAGAFSGSALGTLVGVNGVSAFGGYLFDIQSNGFSMVRGAGAGSGLQALDVQARPSNTGGEQGTILESPADPGALTAITQTLKVKGGVLTFNGPVFQRMVEFTAPTYGFATGPQTFSQVETLLINGAPILGANATFTQSVAAKIVGGLVLDGTGSIGSQGFPITLNASGGFFNFNPAVASANTGLQINPQSGTINANAPTLGSASGSVMTLSGSFATFYTIGWGSQHITANVDLLTLTDAASMAIVHEPFLDGTGGFTPTVTNLWALLAIHGHIGMQGSAVVLNGTNVTSGGASTPGLAFGAQGGLGIYWGSGVPNKTAPQGSLYLRTNGSSATTRAYINTDGATTWTSIATAA